MLFKLSSITAIVLSLNGARAIVQYSGVNIAGFDFGCSSDGKCARDGTTPPLLSKGQWKLPHVSRYRMYSDGPGQMEHFSGNHGMNIYRLPVAWQYLLNWQLGAKLEKNAFGLYDDLMQGCLATGSHCIIDIHNYGRWGGIPKVIGQGGPSNAQFESLWRQLAERYRNEDRVVFGLMNEPHGMDMGEWASTIQGVVTAIRRTGANSQMILLPGTNYTNAIDYQIYSAPDLSSIKNLDGSNHNLVYEVHKYFGEGNKSPHQRCTTNHIEDTFQPLAAYLRQHGRKVFVGEAGGGPTESSCIHYICQAIQFFNDNSDVFLGYTGWSAGAFFSTGELSLTPHGSAKAGWRDQPLLTQCMSPMKASPYKGLRNAHAPSKPQPKPTSPNQSNPKAAPKPNPHTNRPAPNKPTGNTKYTNIFHTPDFVNFWKTHRGPWYKWVNTAAFKQWLKQHPAFQKWARTHPRWYKPA